MAVELTYLELRAELKTFFTTKVMISDYLPRAPPTIHLVRLMVTYVDCANCRSCIVNPYFNQSSALSTIGRNLL